MSGAGRRNSTLSSKNSPPDDRPSSLHVPSYTTQSIWPCSQHRPPQITYRSLRRSLSVEPPHIQLWKNQKKNNSLSSIWGLKNYQPEAKDVFTIHKLQAGCRKGRKMLFFVHEDLDLWPWHSDWSKWGTKHIFHVNLAQIRSVVPEIFHTQTKKPPTDGAKNRTFHSSLVGRLVRV